MTDIRTVTLPNGESFNLRDSRIDSITDEAVNIYYNSFTASQTVTLTASGWSNNQQTVTVNGISSDESTQVIQPAPANSIRAVYYSNGVEAIEQSTNSLTFECVTVPEVDLTVYVAIIDIKPSSNEQSIVLTASSWSNNQQTVTVNGVLADESAQVIQPVPVIASRRFYYYAYGIQAISQAENSLTFECINTPKVDITVNVAIIDLRNS